MICIRDCGWARRECNTTIRISKKGILENMRRVDRVWMSNASVEVFNRVCDLGYEMEGEQEIASDLMRL